MLQAGGQFSVGEPMFHDPFFGEYSGTKPVTGSPNWSSTVTLTRRELTEVKNRDEESRRSHGSISSIVPLFSCNLQTSEGFSEDVPNRRLRRQDVFDNLKAILVFKLEQCKGSGWELDFRQRKMTPRPLRSLHKR